jgi:hypothetical protein
MRTSIMVGIMIVCFVGGTSTAVVLLGESMWEDDAQRHLDAAREADSALSVWRELAQANRICLEHDETVLEEYVDRADDITCEANICTQNRDTFRLQEDLMEVENVNKNSGVGFVLAMLWFIPVFVVIIGDGLEWW